MAKRQRQANPDKISGNGEYVVTRKIEIRINSNDPEKRKEIYHKLYRMQTLCTTGSNLVASHLFMLSASEQMIYFKNKAETPENEFDAQDVYKLMTEHTKSILKVSTMGAMYQMLAEAYQSESIPSVVLSALGTQVYKNFTKELPDIRLGKKSLRTYKFGMPMPFTAASIRNVTKDAWTHPETGTTYHNFAFTLFGMPFVTRFGKDLSDNKTFFRKSMSEWFLPGYIHDNETKLSQAMVKAEESVRKKKPQAFNPAQGEKPKTEKQLRSLYLELLTTDPDKKDFIISDEKLSFSCQLIKLTSTNIYYQVKARRGEDECMFKMEACYRHEMPAWKIVSDIDFGDSALLLSKKPARNDPNKMVTKIFLLSVFKQQRQAPVLNPDKIAYCELHNEVPIRVTIDKRTYDIGSYGAYIQKRININNALREVTRNAKENRGGRGRADKMRYPAHYEKVEKDFVKNQLHEFSRKLITLCLQFECKTIVLVNQKAKMEETKQDKWKLRYWSTGGLKEFIHYKANIQGMIVKEDGKEAKPEEMVL